MLSSHEANLFIKHELELARQLVCEPVELLHGDGKALDVLLVACCDGDLCELEHVCERALDVVALARVCADGAALLDDVCHLERVRARDAAEACDAHAADAVAQLGRRQLEAAAAHKLDLDPRAEPRHRLDELEALCRKEFTYKPWRKFILSVLEDEAIRVPLLTAPAAKSVHHAWVGGLLEHTLSVATLCLRFCDHYPDLDRQTLLAGAICHDLGKIWEFSGGLANDYTDAGRLVGHINLCLGKLDRHLAKSGLDEELILHFQHLILSHHGLYEYGSPRLPQTAEAFALHYADNIDAKITQSRSLFGELEDGESGWSPYQKSLERQLFQAPKTPEAESRKPRTSKRTAAEPEAPRLNQCSLL